jgi:hypothetical protein
VSNLIETLNYSLYYLVLISTVSTKTSKVIKQMMKILVIPSPLHPQKILSMKEHIKDTRLKILIVEIKMKLKYLIAFTLNKKTLLTHM